MKYAIKAERETQSKTIVTKEYRYRRGYGEFRGALAPLVLNVLSDDFTRFTVARTNKVGS